MSIPSDRALQVDALSFKLRKYIRTWHIKQDKEKTTTNPSLRPTTEESFGRQAHVAVQAAQQKSQSTSSRCEKKSAMLRVKQLQDALDCFNNCDLQ